MNLYSTEKNMRVSVPIFSRAAEAQAQLIHHRVVTHPIFSMQGPHLSLIRTDLPLIMIHRKKSERQISVPGTLEASKYWGAQMCTGRNAEEENLGKAFAEWIWLVLVVEWKGWNGTAMWGFVVISRCSFYAKAGTEWGWLQLHALNDQLWRKTNGTTRAFSSVCGFCELQTSLKNEKKKAKRDWPSKLSRERFLDSHDVFTLDLHSSLLHSLRIPLGKERKSCSGDDLNPVVLLEVGCPIWNKPSIFTGRSVSSASSRPTSSCQ